MKIEAGKYYKNRAGEVLGPMEHNSDDVYPFTCQADGRYRSYMVDGTFYVNHEGDDDLVEECNADGSPIVPESSSGLSWNVPADRSWRDEIALRVLPSFLRENPKLTSFLDPNKTIGQEAVERAFYIADEFIKVAKQS